jgi:hypothetical protein
LNTAATSPVSESKLQSKLNLPGRGAGVARRDGARAGIEVSRRAENIVVRIPEILMIEDIKELRTEL